MSDQILYSYKDASKRLGYVVSDTWLQGHKKQLPHTQIGTKVGFSEEQLAEIIQMFAVRPIADHDAPVERTKLPIPQALSELKPRGARGRKSA